MAAIVFLSLVAALCQSAIGAGGAEWSYSGSNGPSQWYKAYPQCNQNSQSPINIYQGDVTADAISEAFQYTNYDTASGLTMKLINNGHTAKVSLSGDNLPQVTGGGLNGQFQAAQFHFHWNKDPSKGSEHLVSSRGYPSELHIVHYNMKYDNLSEAVDKPDGLAVLGFMLEISDSDNDNYADLISSLAKVVDKDSPEVTLKAARLDSFLPKTYTNFFRYSGSLTTPPCFESVTWTVFNESIKISEDQLEQFMNLQTSDKKYIFDNVRPALALNNREVKASFNPAIHWSYHHGAANTYSWDRYYSACGQKSQSPINIPKTAATKDATLGAFNLANFDRDADINMTISNNGHTVKVSVSGSGVPKVSGGGLPEEYTVAQFHFHWGSSSMNGSEHTLDGVMYPMEIHIVTFKSSLGSLGNAVKQPEGLAVLGFFYEISDSDNANLAPILSMFPSISSPKSEADMSSAVHLETLIPTDLSNYYRYSGSLTTPGCYESVIWTVFDSKIPISESQIAKFRSLKSSDKESDSVYYKLENNYRPVQYLFAREVKRNFDPVSEKKEWTYFGDKRAEFWYKDYSVCASTVRQSPIDIPIKDVLFKDLPQFTFTGFDSTAGVTLKLENNGHTAVVSYEAGSLEVTGGDLPGTFKVAQFHFHWGSASDKGSEHLVDGEAYPIEVHIVTYNTMYSDIGLAMTQGNGLAVLGMMFKISDSDNPDLDTMLSGFDQIKDPKTSTAIDAFPLDKLLPKDQKQFYRYDGSLTTPNCAESVTWTLFKEPLSISKKQLDKFRALVSVEEDADGNKMMMVDNFRPPQPLGKRSVYANFVISAAPTPRTTTLAPVVASFVYYVTFIWN